MAIKTEYYTTRADGVRLVRTYSDAGMMIERDGARYEEAIDPEECGRVYVETNEPVPIFEGLTVSEYEEAGKILLGVSR